MAQIRKGSGRPRRQDEGSLVNVRTAAETVHSGASGVRRGRGSRVGVAVCTRNRPQKLRRLLESIADQSLPPAELTVVDLSLIHISEPTRLQV